MAVPDLTLLVAATPADGKSFTMQLAGFEGPDAGAILAAGDITRVLIFYTETCG